jgi:beta-phosphoglucomutase-like phosphatase (HAD superfamily)
VNIKALIFDVDGTLADTEDAHRHAFNRAFERHRLDWRWRTDEYADLLEVTGGKERLAAYIDALELPESDRSALKQLIPAIHDTKTENYTQLIREGLVPLRPGVARLIDEAERAGVRLSIASTTTLANIEALLSVNLGRSALDSFAVIGAGDAVPRKKPAADIFLYVLDALEQHALDCVAIEDSAHGLAAAKSAGLYTVITPSQWTRDQDFRAADLLVRSLGSSPHPLADIDNHFSLARGQQQ